ncbi:hypothetical protein WJX81_002193 [Elliptochloris bilobata]|uniref:Uncharacterized protein n=1 Tax=Elliptochloris bilobata TaxID=381761 RepID=A0AAW1QNC6_9CHLO
MVVMGVLFPTETSAALKPAKGASASLKSRLLRINLAASSSPDCTSTVNAKEQSSSTVRRIRLASSWQDVASALSDSNATSGDVAYALYRVGCLFCFMSEQRRAALEASGMMARLGHLAREQLPRFTPRDVTLTLDAYARLAAKPQMKGLRPPPALLAGLSARAGRLAHELEASQLPLVIWALGVLGCSEAEADMAALDKAVARRAADFSGQGVSLVLWAYCALRHHPSAHAWRRRMHPSQRM